MNRKAQIGGEDVQLSSVDIQTIVWSIVVTLGLAGMSIVFAAFLRGTLTFPDELSTSLEIQRFTSSTSGLVYQQGVRAYPGILDWQLFENDSKIMGSYLPTEYNKAYRLTLTLDNGVKRTIATRNWNDDAKTGARRTQPVMAMENNKLVFASLLIEIQPEVMKDR